MRHRSLFLSLSLPLSLTDLLSLCPPPFLPRSHHTTHTHACTHIHTPRISRHRWQHSHSRLNAHTWGVWPTGGLPQTSLCAHVTAPSMMSAARCELYACVRHLRDSQSRLHTALAADSLYACTMAPSLMSVTCSNAFCVCLCVCLFVCLSVRLWLLSPSLTRARAHTHAHVSVYAYPHMRICTFTSTPLGHHSSV